MNPVRDERVMFHLYDSMDHKAGMILLGLIDYGLPTWVGGPISNGMKIVDYIKATKGELKYVNWPTRRQAILFTILVIIISFAVAYYLGFFDFIFSLGLEKIL